MGSADLVRIAFIYVNLYVCITSSCWVSQELRHIYPHAELECTHDLILLLNRLSMYLFSAGEYVVMHKAPSDSADTSTLSVVDDRDVQKGLWWPTPAAAVCSAET